MKVTKMKMPMVFIVGILVGMLITGAVSAATHIPISAYLDNQISVLINGEQKALPEDMNIIIYNDRTYTPARFIAEELGAEVGWDAVTRSVLITKAEEEAVPCEPIEEETAPDPEEEKEEEPIDVKNYKDLPQSIVTGEAIINLTHVDVTSNVSWFFLEVESRTNTPFRIDQRNAEIEAGGITQLQSEVSGIPSPVDSVWYNDIRKDDLVTGWIKFTAIDEDEEYVKLELPYIINDASQTKKTVTFKIEL